ncbi:MAG: sigma-70 family RNA polymerase sigma factor [Sedimentisphaeraceae bacterium JB056]
MTDDIKTIKRCIKGSHKAFASLVEKYKNLVCSIAYCSTGNIDTSEDIAQDVFISVWEDLESLKDHSKFKSWLITITRNTSRLYLRKQQSVVSISNTTIPEATTTPDTPSQKLIADEENSLIWQTLETLPDQYREVMVLYYRHEKSAKQVGELMGISADAVRQRLSRGRQMIRERIEDRLEAGLRNSAPDKKFTASVIAAISSIPVGVAVSEAAVTASACASAPFVATLQTIMATTAAKVATVAIIAAAAIATGLILNNNEKSQPIQNTETIQPITATDSSHVETHFNASENLTKPNATPIPQELQQAPAEQQTTETPQPTESPAATEETTDAFTPRGVLSGLITDKETGEPVIDAQISLALPNGETATTHVDENGLYYFDELTSYGICELGISSTQYVGLNETFYNTVSLNISENAKINKNIQLEKACMLEIETIDEQGNPIKDVKVSIGCSEEYGIYEEKYNFSETTDDTGKLMVGGIKPSNNAYLINLLYNPNVEDKNAGLRGINSYAPQKKKVILTEPELIQNIKITMRKGFDINGKLLLHNGTPAVNYRVSVTPEWWFSENCLNFYTDEEGLFSIKNIEAGTYKIIYSNTDSSQNHKLEMSSILNNDDYLSIILPEKKYQTETVSENLSTFSGTLITEGGCDLDIINIKCKNDDHNYRQTVKINDNKTHFTINNIVPGIYDISIHGSYWVRSEIIPISLKNIAIPCDDFEQILKCVNRSDITGQVVSEVSGKPINNFKILHQFIRSHVSLNSNNDGKWTEYLDNRDGKFMFKAQEEGCHKFIITSKGYAPFITTLNTSKSANFTAELTEGTTLNGRIIDSKGKPIKAAKIIPLTINSRAIKADENILTNNHYVLSDGDGCFILSKLPEEKETIKVVHPDYEEKSIEVELPEKVNETKITLESGSVIEGYLYSNNSKIIPNHPISLSSIRDISFPISTTTDQDGYYKFDNISSGLWNIRHRYVSNTNGGRSCSIFAAEGQKTQFNLGDTFLLTGKVFINGSPLSNAKLWICNPYLFFPSMFIYKGQTDSEGSFQFSGIPKGIKKLVYVMPDRSDGQRLIKEFDTNGQNLDLGNIFLDCVDVEITIEGSENDAIRECLFTEEKDYILPTSLIDMKAVPIGNNKYEAKNIAPGKYFFNVERKKQTGIFVFEAKIDIDSKPQILNFKLPETNSSVFGTTNFQNDVLICKKEDSSFFIRIRPSKDNTYKIENIPHGKYIIESMHTGRQLTSFELEKEQSLELNLGMADPAIKQLIVVDKKSGIPIPDYSAWLEKDGGRLDIKLKCEIGVAPGIYTLHVIKPEYKDHIQTIDMPQPYTGTAMQYITVILERE